MESKTGLELSMYCMLSEACQDRDVSFFKAVGVRQVEMGVTSRPPAKCQSSMSVDGCLVGRIADFF